MVLGLDNSLEEQDLIYGMHKQLDVWSDTGGIPPGYTSFHWCVKKKKCQKKIFCITLGPKELDLRTHFNIYFGSYVYRHHS